MQAKALYHDGNLATLAAFITENLATQFDLDEATHIAVDLIEKRDSEGVYLFQVK